MDLLWYWPFARPEELAWARAVASTGHRITVVVVDREGAPAPSEADRALGLEVAPVLADVDRSIARGPMWLASRAKTYRARAGARRRIAHDGDFDLVHYHYLNRFTDAWRRPSGTWVVSVHDVMPHQPRLGPLEQRLLWLLYRRPDGLVVHHDWLRRELQDAFGIDADRVQVVPHQVFPVERPVERSVDAPTTVLFFGALRPNKGLEVLLDAVRGMGSEVTLHIAGRGDRGLERLAVEAAEALPNVTAEIGRVDEDRKAELFRSCRVVALPYTSFSSQSGVLHDAYGHWRPVVVSEVGALGETVRADGTGAVVPAGDVAQLRDAIAQMAGSDGDPCARAARQVAVDRSPTAVATATLAAYRAFGVG